MTTMVWSLCSLAQGQPIYISTWGERGTGNGQFIQPLGAAIDSNGNVYVTDPATTVFKNLIALALTWNNGAPLVVGMGNSTNRMPLH